MYRNYLSEEILKARRANKKVRRVTPAEERQAKARRAVEDYFDEKRIKELEL